MWVSTSTLPHVYTYSKKIHGTTVKIIEAQQAKPYNNYKNTKLKLLKANAAIWFNKVCKTKQLFLYLY
jgi:hypothetical protein